MSNAVSGGCLCGGVRFEVNPPFIRAGHCHCSRCRKHSGTFGLTQARVKREQFRLVQGADLIRVYGKGQGAVKAFCITCGSSLFGGTWPDGSQVSIRMGAFDGDHGIRPQFPRTSDHGRRGIKSQTHCPGIKKHGCPCPSEHPRRAMTPNPSLHSNVGHRYA